MAPIADKLVNKSRHSESLKNTENRQIAIFAEKWLQFQQFGRKRYQKKREAVNFKLLLEFFKNHLVYELQAVRYKA